MKTNNPGIPYELTYKEKDREPMTLHVQAHSLAEAETIAELEHHIPRSCFIQLVRLGPPSIVYPTTPPAQVPLPI